MSACVALSGRQLRQAVQFSGLSTTVYPAYSCKAVKSVLAKSDLFQCERRVGVGFLSAASVLSPRFFRVWAGKQLCFLRVSQGVKMLGYNMKYIYIFFFPLFEREV